MSAVPKLACCLLGPMLLVAAGAQATPAPSDTSITVIGEQPAQLRKEVADYIDAVGVVIRDEPAARWVDSICPHAVGIPDAIAAKVIAQVRATAASVGAPVASAKCKPNLLLAFTEDAPAVVREISRRGPLGDATHEQREQLEKGSAPIRWWYTTEFRNADGTPMDSAGSPALHTSSGSVYGAYADFGFAARKGSTNAYSASLIELPTLRAISHATVVIDVNRSSGKTLSSVVDYATLVALAQVRENAAPQGSVLGLFQSASSPRLGSNDRAMLSALYQLQLTRKADQHRRALAAGIFNARLSQKPR